VISLSNWKFWGNSIDQNIVTLNNHIVYFRGFYKVVDAYFFISQSSSDIPIGLMRKTEVQKCYVAYYESGWQEVGNG
jgi:hypothetical protein